MATQLASRIRDAAWLQWVATLMGGTSRQTYASTFPSDKFYCLLDELPLHLVPRQFFKARCFQKDIARPLFLNPHCIIFQAGQLPDGLSRQKELVDNFALQRTIAWVRDPVTMSPLPFWLGPRLEARVRSLRHDEPAGKMPEEDLVLLIAAGILSPKDQNSSSRRSLNDLAAKSASSFQAQGYAPLNDLIHPFHVAALRRYYRYLIRHGKIRLGDQQSPRRYIAYNESVARFFHQQIAATVGMLAGQLIKPSYVYLASYRSGAELKKHTDREQCEFSVTLCLDFSPEPTRETSWPIRLQTPQGTTFVYQALGDGLVYRGTRVPHYRGVLAEGKTSTSIFFHYVAADFKGSLD